MNKKRKFAFYGCLLVFLAAVAYLAGYYMRQQEKEAVYDRIAREAQVTAAPSPSSDTEEETSPAPTEEAAEKTVEIPVDYDRLQQENPDIYAWITIPDTEVDYPILQRYDASYYLNHTVDGQEGLPGSIYTEALNSKDFTDPNTVIYGHNMRDGSMFGGLKQYMDASYMKEHSQIIIYTPEHRLTYQVFAAVTYDDRHILQSFDFRDDQSYQSFLDSLRQVRNMSSYIDEETAVTTEDRILTLSTCNGNEQERFLVEAVLIDEE